MDAATIRQLVRRLARSHGPDTVIVEGVAVRAEGSDFDAVEGWILANGGRPEAVAKRPPPAGLHGARFGESDALRDLGTVRYVLPSAVLETPADDDESAASGSGPSG